MEAELKNLKDKSIAELGGLKSTAELGDFEIRVLGRKGELTMLLRGLSALSAEERPKAGALANEIKKEIEAALNDKKSKLREKILGNLAESEWIDTSLPGERLPNGSLHLVTRAIREITDIFSRIGFTRVRYPEVEWDYYAFEALNMPEGHPARDEWETFFIDAPAHSKWGKMILTPHTSSGQVREMERKELPIRMINIGKTYRRQSDISHVPMFHQFEGLFIDKDVSVANLKGVLDYFVREFFGKERKIRLRPFHFRFTEPSFEIDISCGVCGGGGKVEGIRCRLCKEGWLELGGAGMVHPNVLKAGKIDPKKWSGFAFGWGVERTAMMRSGVKIDDVRILYENDLRFLKQF
ncbi:phenylalanine--tRNA ligase subunit alpha [Candidatus Uhrbacteria bacterium]|nr:phenylalanine--tRNA ligase subunit alpha [Candidatus Uhrbacteria bacterium]